MLISLTPLVYKVLRTTNKNFPQVKKFPRLYNFEKGGKGSAMQKKFGHDKTSIEIDNITGEYYTIIPEWVMHDQDWFEGTKVKWALEVDEVIITEDDE